MVYFSWIIMDYQKGWQSLLILLAILFSQNGFLGY